MSRILFAGTPEIAVPLLKALAGRFDVAGVLTSVDKPQGRSSVPVPPPVKTAALELGLPVIQFESLRTEARAAVKALGADVLVTFAFGKIFGPMFLALFPKGAFNVHPSALPLFRGPSPIQATILGGLETGSISFQNVGLKMDEGDIWARYDFPLDGTETTQSLTQKVSLLAAEFVPAALEAALSGRTFPSPQSGSATYCSMLDKTAAKLDFSRPAAELHAKVRAMYPWPKAWCTVNGTELFITSVWGGFAELEAEPAVTPAASGAPFVAVEPFAPALLDTSAKSIASDAAGVPGTVVAFRKDRGVGVLCADKILWITGFQLPSKKELDFKAFANGNGWVKTAVLG